MNFLTTPILYGLGGLALVLGLTAGVQTMRLNHAKTNHAQTMAKIAEAAAESARLARETEQRHGAIMGAVAQQHQEDLQHAQATYDATVFDLRSGAIRLQDRWGCADLSRVNTGPGLTDGQADDRSESAARIVRAAQECDSQVLGLQAVVIGDRAVGPKQ